MEPLKTNKQKWKMGILVIKCISFQKFFKRLNIMQLDEPIQNIKAHYIVCSIEVYVFVRGKRSQQESPCWSGKVARNAYLINPP